MLESLVEMMSNQFLSGGLVLMLFGSALYLTRRWSSQFIQWCRRQSTVSLEVRNDDPAFNWVEMWLDANPYSKKSRRMTLTTLRHNKHDDKEYSTVLTPSPGHHFFIYKKRLVWLKREFGEGGGKKPDGGSAAGGIESIFGMKSKETFTFTLLGRSQSVIRDLVDDIQKTAKARMKDEPTFYVATYGYWSKRGDIIKKSLNSVVLPPGVTEGIADDIEWFFNARQWYAERGVPYRRGYLLHGLPGSGKSSLVMALAAELDKNLYMLNISSGNMSDDRLYELMSSVENDSIILFEDIDVVAPRRRAKLSKDETVITLTGLLNAIDGPAARESVAVFMTTNHKETLDPALIRPGRCDVHVEFTHATPDQAYRLFSRFYGESSSVTPTTFAALSNGNPMSMADIQQLLISNKDRPDQVAHALSGGHS